MLHVEQKDRTNCASELAETRLQMFLPVKENGYYFEDTS